MTEKHTAWVEDRSSRLGEKKRTRERELEFLVAGASGGGLREISTVLETARAKFPVAFEILKRTLESSPTSPPINSPLYPGTRLKLRLIPRFER